MSSSTTSPWAATWKSILRPSAFFDTNMFLPMMRSKISQNVTSADP